MSYNTFSSKGSSWSSGSTTVINFDTSTGSYTFVANYHQSSSFLVSGSVRITGSAAGGGPDGTLFTIEAGGSGRDVDGKVVLHAQASGGYGRVGIGKPSPKVELDVAYESVSDPNNFAPDGGGGEVVFFGTSTATVAGKLFFLNDTSSWNIANADVTGSGHHQLLAIALGTNSQTDGMLIRGWFNATTFYEGTFMPGYPVYIHSGTAGYMSASAPTADNSYARIVGHGSANGNLIYFNPSSNWIELTGSS